MRAFYCVLSLLLSILMASEPAKADDWADCKVSTPPVRLAACTRIIEKGGLNPKELATAHRYRSAAYSGAKEKDKATADLNEAIRLDPKNGVYFRGLIHLNEEENDAAILDFDKAIKSNPRDAEIYNSRGVAYARQRDADHAIADYNEAIRLDPAFALALSNRASAYRNQGELEKAFADANEAIRLQPNFSTVFYGRGLTFEKKGDLDSALADCERAIQLDPKYTSAYAERGYLYSRKNDFDRALDDANKAIEIDPQANIGYYVRGLSYAAKGELDKALTDYNSAIQVDPRNSITYIARGNVYVAKNMVDRAIVDYDLAMKLNDKNPLVYYNRGRAYEKKHKIERALSDYRKVLELPAPLVAEKQRQEVARQRIARLTETNRNPAAGPAQNIPRVKRVALVIGNGKYASIGQLSNPPNDAKGIATSLRRLGFGYVMELYDLTREQMGRALKDFGDRAENAEWAVVFFAGHGLEMGGVNYLIPTDAELSRDSHVVDETISLTQIQAKVDAASKFGLIILDACRNNPFLSRMARTGSATRAIGRGLASVEPEGNVMVAYSAKHGTTAQDGAEGNSPFTEALLKHLEEPGLEVQFLFRKVRDDVLAKTHRQQEPYVYDSLSSEPLYFVETAAK